MTVNDGILITEKVLKALGATKSKQSKGMLYTLNSRGYEFRFYKENPDDGAAWELYTDSGQLPPPSHFVTHLVECFGFIAEDFFEFGKDAKAEEVREVLNIKGGKK